MVLLQEISYGERNGKGPGGGSKTAKISQELWPNCQYFIHDLNPNFSRSKWST